ncbi:MAG: molybdopterin-guanine dinucleotide biosynthesis protein B [Anaerolineae bacterium]
MTHPADALLAPPVICVVGRSKAGKTTLLEKLIPRLKERGYRLATIKHHSHPGIEMDRPGKDTWRHARAGSDHVIIAAPDRVASIRRVERPPTLDELAAGIKNVDLQTLKPAQNRSGAGRPQPRTPLRARRTAGRGVRCGAEPPRRHPPLCAG